MFKNHDSSLMKLISGNVTLSKDIFDLKESLLFTPDGIDENIIGLNM